MKTLDDIYRETLFKTNLSTTDLPYSGNISAVGYSFTYLFGEVYKNLVGEVVQSDLNYFLTRTYDNLVADQEVYYLPNDLIQLRHIEFNYDGSSNSFQGTPIDPTQFKRGSEQATVSAATQYQPYFWLGDSVTNPSSPYHIAPRPRVNVTSGIIMYYEKMPSALFSTSVSAAISAASAQVLFPGQFEYLIPLGCSVELWGKYGQREQKADEIARYEAGLADIRKLMKPRIDTGQHRMKDFRELNVRDI